MSDIYCDNRMVFDKTQDGRREFCNLISQLQASQCSFKVVNEPDNYIIIITNGV